MTKIKSKKQWYRYTKVRGGKLGVSISHTAATTRDRAWDMAQQLVDQDYGAAYIIEDSEALDERGQCFRFRYYLTRR